MYDRFQWFNCFFHFNIFDLSKMAHVRVKTVTHVLVGHVPIRSFPIGHDLPHDNAVTPHVTCRGEFTILYGFWRSPSHGNLPSLFSKMHVSGCSTDEKHYTLHLPTKQQLKTFWFHNHKNPKSSWHCSLTMYQCTCMNCMPTIGFTYIQ